MTAPEPPAPGTPTQPVRDRSVLGDGASYDVVVCGSGPGGSVVAARLAEEVGVSVLLLEAGGDDERGTIQSAWQWPANFGGDAEWKFVAAPSDALNGRAIPYATGRGLGGGGSINVSVWARGHQADWNSYAALTGDDAWDYDHVQGVYERIEDYDGPDRHRRGHGGTLRVTPIDGDDDLFRAVLDAAEQQGIARQDSLNGVVMESGHGTAIRDTTADGDHRRSPYRAYVHAHARPNLTVVTGAEVDVITFDGLRATGVRLTDGTVVRAARQVVLACGAVNTPAVLMRSGIGDREDLEPLGIEVRQHLPGVGRNLHDHVNVPIVWAVDDDRELPPPLRAPVGIYWDLDAPDSHAVVLYVDTAPVLPPHLAARDVPAKAVTFLTGVRLRSRGRVTLASTAADAPVVEHGYFTDPADLPAVLRVLDRATAIGTGDALKPFLARRAFPPADADEAAVVDHVREATQTFWHACGTAAMGTGPQAVVDSRLRVHGTENLRIADASVLPHAPVGNTMAPTLVVGEQAAAFLRHDLS